MFVWNSAKESGGRTPPGVGTHAEEPVEGWESCFNDMVDKVFCIQQRLLVIDHRMRTGEINRKRYS